MEISREAMSFLWACLLGAGLGVVYDGFRLMRLVCRNFGVVLAEDLVFSALCTLATWWFLVEFCSGRVRVYALLGELLGFLLYHFTVGEVVIRILEAVVRLIRGVFRGIYRILIAPVGRAVRWVARKVLAVFRWLLQCLKRLPFLRKFPLQHTGGMLYNKYNKRKGRNKGGAEPDENQKEQGEPHR